MEIATIREVANFTNKTNAVSPYCLGQILKSYATKEYVEEHGGGGGGDVNDVQQNGVSVLDTETHIANVIVPTALSQLTNDYNYVRTVSGKIPGDLLPSYVDDVLEYDTITLFPNPGESGKIYIALDTNKTYRWGGTSYVTIGTSLALGETSETAYRGDRGKAAYEHSQVTGTNPHGVTLSNLGVTASSTEINYLNGLTENILTALGKKLNISGGTLTGYLTLHSNPTSNMHASTKFYVDDSISNLSLTISTSYLTLANYNTDMTDPATGIKYDLQQINNVSTLVKDELGYSEESGTFEKFRSVQEKAGEVETLTGRVLDLEGIANETNLKSMIENITPEGIQNYFATSDGVINISNVRGLDDLKRWIDDNRGNLDNILPFIKQGVVTNDSPLKEYITVGEPYIMLSSPAVDNDGNIIPNGNNQLLLSSEKLLFVQGNSPVAYMSGQMLNIANETIMNTIQLNHWLISEDESNNLNFSWKDGDR